jgi:hypothetical protein
LRYILGFDHIKDFSKNSLYQIVLHYKYFGKLLASDALPQVAVRVNRLVMALSVSSDTFWLCTLVAITFAQ